MFYTGPDYTASEGPGANLHIACEKERNYLRTDNERLQKDNKRLVDIIRECLPLVRRESNLFKRMYKECNESFKRANN